MNRRACRVDANHAEVVAAIVAAGGDVIDLSAVGEGVPDLLVGIAGRFVLVEVKDGKKKPSAQALTVMQTWFHRRMQSQRLPCIVVRSAEEAVRVLTGGTARVSGGAA